MLEYFAWYLITSTCSTTLHQVLVSDCSWYLICSVYGKFSSWCNILYGSVLGTLSQFSYLRLLTCVRNCMTTCRPGDLHAEIAFPKVAFPLLQTAVKDRKALKGMQSGINPKWPKSNPSSCSIHKTSVLCVCMLLGPSKCTGNEKPVSGTIGMPVNNRLFQN